MLVCLVAGAVGGKDFSSAFALSPERAYELVTPSYKAGYGVYGGAIEAVAANGQSVGFVSQGSFEGEPTAKAFNMYLARRGGSGWSTVPVEPPSPVAPSAAEYESVADFSPTLEEVLAVNTSGANAGQAEYESPEREFLIHNTNTADVKDNWFRVGPVELLSKGPFNVGYEGSSEHFCHIAFNPQFDQQPLLPEAVGTKAELYDLASGCEGQPKLRLVGLDNQRKVINPRCTEWFGGFGDGSHESTFNAMSADGSEIFFTAFVEPHASSPSCGLSVAPTASDPSQLFVRLGGARTVEISRTFPSKCTEVPCEHASTRSPSLFWGASEDGSKVFFTTSSRLVEEDKDTGNDLYMATIGCPNGQQCEAAQRDLVSLVDVSHTVSGQASEVQGVVKIAADGSRVYFVARGVLTEGVNSEGRAPTNNADNLYVFDSLTSKVTFVADLCSGPGVSGVIESSHCAADLESEGSGKERNDANLWLVGRTEHEAQITGPAVDQSRFLVFTSFDQTRHAWSGRRHRRREGRVPV